MRANISYGKNSSTKKTRIEILEMTSLWTYPGDLQGEENILTGFGRF